MPIIYSFILGSFQLVSSVQNAGPQHAWCRVDFIHVNLVQFIHKHFPCLYLFGEIVLKSEVLAVLFIMNKNHLIAPLFFFRLLLPGQC